MNARQVCTGPTNYGRIVSLNSQPPGATSCPTAPFLDPSGHSPRPSVLIPLGASSRRIRGDEYHFIFTVGTKDHLCARTLYGSKMFTLPLQTVDLTLSYLIYSLPEKILKRSQSPAHSAKDKKIGVGSPNPVVKSPLSGKSEWAVVTLINLIYSLTKGSNFDSVQWPSGKTPQTFRFPFEFFAFFVVNPFFKSAFRNRLCTHERPVYRRLSRIIGFEISPKSDRTKQFPVCQDRWSATNCVTYGHIKSLNALLTPRLIASLRID
jgi:hypothetical protein